MVNRKTSANTEYSTNSKTGSMVELEKIVDEATDAIEYKLVIATLKVLVRCLDYDSRYALRRELESLNDEYDTTMKIADARRKCKAAIKAVSIALQYN